MPTPCRHCAALPRSHALALACTLGVGSLQAHAQAAEPPPTDPAAGFDAQTLRLHGIDPATVRSLLQGPRFTTGPGRVELQVNGQRRGRVDVQFNELGLLCADDALLAAAGLDARNAADTAACPLLEARVPGASAQYDPGELRIALVVPTGALQPGAREPLALDQGGLAALFNYQLMGQRTDAGNRSRRYASAYTEAGFNAGNWIVRSRQTYVTSDGQSHSTHLDAYAQRSFVDAGVVLQGGQINLANPVLAGAPITGVQLGSETGLPGRSGGARVQGMALLQSRVEVRQGAALVYTAVVPAGAFELSDVPIIDTRTDLDVTVTGDDGSQQQFVVPAALATSANLPGGFNIGVGKVRDIAVVDGTRPWLASAGWAGAVRGRLQLGVGGLLGRHYRGLGVGLATPLWRDAQMRLDLTGSQDRLDAVNGSSVRLTFNQALNDRWAINTSAEHQSNGFRNFLDTVSDTADATYRNRFRDQLGGGISWSSPLLGRFNISATHANLHNGNTVQRSIASWGRQFGQVSVSATAQRSRGGALGRDNSLYATVSIPLDSNRRAQGTYRNTDRDSRAGVAYSERVNDAFSYRGSVEHADNGQGTDYSMGINAIPRYTQLDLSYARYGSGMTSYLGTLRGGIVAHGGGLTLSPYPVQETFGLIALTNAPKAGIKISTPSGPVWTDFRGQAIAPALSAYRRTPVEIITHALPRNLDVGEGIATPLPMRGAVPKIAFRVAQTRRVLLTARDNQGNALPAGAAVLDAHDDLITLVQDEGSIFVPNVLSTPQLWMHSKDGVRCKLEFEMPARADLSVRYETALAVCRP